MAELKGSKTHNNLTDAFAGESQANRRYLYFAKQADMEGLPDVAGLFRDTADGETGHAHGHLDFLKKVVTGPSFGTTANERVYITKAPRALLLICFARVGRRFIRICNFARGSQSH
jgi:rubrerythrin